MIVSQALAAYAHFVFIFITIGFLVAEFMVYSDTLTFGQARLLSRLDQAYFLGAMGILATGFLRALYFAKGWAFYESNPIFWGKVGAYVVWALFSLPPTFHFLSWRKDLAEGRAPEISLGQFKRIRLFLKLQLAMVFVLPLLAVLMSRSLV